MAIGIESKTVFYVAIAEFGKGTTFLKASYEEFQRSLSKFLLDKIIVLY